MTIGLELLINQPASFLLLAPEECDDRSESSKASCYRRGNYLPRLQVNLHLAPALRFPSSYDNIAFIAYHCLRTKELSIGARSISSSLAQGGIPVFKPL